MASSSKSRPLESPVLAYFEIIGEKKVCCKLVRATYHYYVVCVHATIIQYQGHIEPPKAARGHATYIDGKMLSVTKYSFQIYFRFHTCNDTSR